MCAARRLSPRVRTRPFAGEERLPLRSLECARARSAPAAHSLPRLVTQIALIAPYKAQLREMSKRLPAAAAEVQRFTVDKCQGQDFDCCIISTVRSNDRGDIGQLLSDWRRLNVAMTRAKSKMIFIGSASTLAHSQLLACLLQLVERRRWKIELPPKAHLLYAAPAGMLAGASDPQAAGALGTRRDAGGARASSHLVANGILQELNPQGAALNYTNGAALPRARDGKGIEPQAALAGRGLTMRPNVLNDW